MDNYRLVLAVTLAFLGMMIWESWQNDYVRQPASAAAVSSTLSVPADTAHPSDLPTPRQEKSSPAVISAGGETLQGETIQVTTDLYQIEIDSLGATLRQAELPHYPLSDVIRDKPFRLLTDSAENRFVIQSGLLVEGAGEAPNHKSLFQAEQQSYTMADGATELVVPLRWTAPNGIAVTKRFIFQRGSYLIRLEQEVANQGEQKWTARDYRQLLRGMAAASKDSNAFIYTFTGGAFYSPDRKFQKLELEELAQTPVDRDVTGGWIAMLQHYFLGALIPARDATAHFYSKQAGDNQYLLGMYGQPQAVAPGGKTTFSGQIWLGPKLQQQLEDVAPGLELSTDYGWLAVIAKPLYWILRTIYDAVGNWGWAIVLLTIMIKLAFYKLSAASYKSMANMRKLAPRLQAIKERFGDDKEAFNKAMMELYQKEKINPLGGCLPMLVQIPVFIALYWVLLETVEMRDAPFIFWIDNLASKDPYFVLPLVMGVSMFVQQKLSPAPPDPMQAKIMMTLPFIFTAFFAFFPSGLVLYWVVNNVLSILQQWRITKTIEQGEK